MHLRAVAVAVGALLVAALPAACSSFSGSTPDRVVDEAGVDAEPAPDAAVDGSKPEPDGGPQPPSGALLYEDFEKETGTVCAGWTVASGATAIVAKDTAHGGSASCRMCFPSASFIEHAVKVPGAGTYAVTAYVEPDSASSVTIGLYAFDGTGAELPNSSRSNVIPLPPGATWRLGQVSSDALPGSVATVNIRFLSVSSGCLWVDDVVLERSQ